MTKFVTKTCPRCRGFCSDSQTICLCSYNFETGLSAEDLKQGRTLDDGVINKLQDMLGNGHSR